MRYLLFLIVIYSSCTINHDSTGKAQTSHQDSLFIELVQNNFLFYVDSDKLDSIKQSFIKDGYFFGAEINRYVAIDAEELAEGSFDFFKTDLKKILNRRGIEITFCTTPNFEVSHEVMINEKIISLYDDEHLADFSFWDIGARRFFRAINQELEMSKSSDRFYLMYSGNDLGAILLTDKQLKIIEIIYEGNSKVIPYKP